MKKAGLLVLLITVASFCAGCAHRIAAITHSESGEFAWIKSSSFYPNVLLTVDVRSRTLRYMSKDHVKGCYLITTYDFNGHAIEKQPFPRFANGCWRDFGYGPGWGGAVSPDGTSVAYFDFIDTLDGRDRDLCWFNARTGARNVLATRLASQPLDIACLLWVSQKEVLVAVDNPRKPDARLLLIDTEGPAIELDLHCRSLRRERFALSQSKRYFAYWEGAEKYASVGSYKILDLLDKKEVAMTRAGEAEVHSSPKWSSDDDALAYIMDNALERFVLASRETQVLRTFPSPDKFIVTLHDYEAGRLFYRVWPTDTLRPAIGFFSVEPRTQKESQLLAPPVHGIFDLRACPDGTLIYYILSQEPL